MFHLCSGIANVNIGKCVGTAFIANEHGVALGIISCIIRIFHNLNTPAVRERRAEFASRPNAVRDALAKGTEHARKVAAETMTEVRSALRLNYLE